MPKKGNRTVICLVVWHNDSRSWLVSGEFQLLTVMAFGDSKIFAPTAHYSSLRLQQLYGRLSYASHYLNHHIIGETYSLSIKDFAKCLGKLVIPASYKAIASAKAKSK